MFDVSWSALLNKLLNLAVLVAACAYLARKYATPYIKKALKDRAAKLLSLEHEALALEIERNKLMRTTHEQESYAVELLGKIQVWKNMMEERERAYDRERKRMEEASLAYLKKRADGLCHEYLKRDVMPHIFSQTKEELLRFFADKKVQHQYLATGLKLLKRGDKRG